MDKFPKLETIPFDTIAKAVKNCTTSNVMTSQEKLIES